MERIVVFSGAGMSAESGLKTFRDSGGLWEEYNIEDVATPEAWAKHPELVLEFYNMRRRQVLEAQPNPAHKAIAKLEEQFDVQIITQNIDDLHERAGSKKVLHLHGEILKAKGESYPDTLYDVTKDLSIGQLCKKGSQLRPHVVWFGEPVPAMSEGIRLMKQADLVLVVGTSLNVYPAAGLVYAAPSSSTFYLIDPNPNSDASIDHMRIIQANASVGVPRLVDNLLKKVSV